MDSLFLAHKALHFPSRNALITTDMSRRHSNGDESTREEEEEEKPSASSSSSSSSSSSAAAAAALDGMAEAIQKGAHLPSLDDRIKVALECPCVKPLRDTSCRDEFDAALTCFMKAEEETRASDCADKFVELHQCMVKHSEEFQEFAEELVKHKNVEGPAQV